jgi:hypothetical protein
MNNDHRNLQANRDPITGAPSAHPVGSTSDAGKRVDPSK